ncbi:MAG: Gfo/Idh/MocA family oxidoreductase [Pirellulaceae bacterium]
MPRRTTRRSFLRQSAAATAAAFAAPAFLRAKSPNEMPNLAGVGVGGKGWGDINSTSKGANVIAFCDVETGKGRRSGGYAKAAEQWPRAKRYTDWRKMLDELGKELDGVTVSTPDHMHAPVTMSALQLGIATYTQKPLTRTVHEARQLTLAAEKAGVVTQMGNQGHSSSEYRTLVDLVQSGVIGKIKEAHAWSNRPIWPQGIDRPAGQDPVPDGLAWDLWLGVAHKRPFKSDVYHPFKWRGWYDFGAGALGDMGCHIIDPVVWALDLKAPTMVWYEGPEPNPETFPTWELIHYDFPGTKYTAQEKIHVIWYDGGKLPPKELALGAELPSNGTLLVGEKGAVLTPHGKGGPKLLPEGEFGEFDIVSGADHYQQWTNAIRGEGQTTSNFGYAGPLTETVLLGTIASRVANKKLQWDSKNLVFPNSPEATAYVKQDYRDGWEVKGLS